MPLFPPRYKVVILGAGISGLTAAWYLKKMAPAAEITVLEKSARPGGAIRTEIREGFLFEYGPHGLSTGPREALQLIDELGLKEELIFAPKKARQRYLYLEGKLQRFGIGFILRHALLGPLWRERKIPPTPAEDESVEAFFTRRYNKKVADIIANPLIRGIYGGNPNQLSMRSSLPRLFAYEKKYGSLLYGFLASPPSSKDYFSFRQGMETLPKRLADHLQSHIHYNTPCLSYRRTKNHIEITTPQGTLKADCLITTLPSTPSLSLTLVHIGFHAPLLKKAGFGYLVPSLEHPQILGMTFDSSTFPQHNTAPQTRLTLMLKGTPPHALDLAHAALQNHLHITAPPDLLHITPLPNAIPQYPLHHHTHLPPTAPPLIHLGTSHHGVGVHDCITSTFRILQNNKFA